jgi:hypothetical protein
VSLRNVLEEIAGKTDERGCHRSTETAGVQQKKKRLGEESTLAGILLRSL